MERPWGEGPHPGAPGAERPARREQVLAAKAVSPGCQTAPPPTAVHAASAWALQAPRAVADDPPGHRDAGAGPTRPRPKLWSADPGGASLLLEAELRRVQEERKARVTPGSGRGCVGKDTMKHTSWMMARFFSSSSDSSLCIGGQHGGASGPGADARAFRRRAHKALTEGSRRPGHGP